MIYKDGEATKMEVVGGQPADVSHLFRQVKGPAGPRIEETLRAIVPPHSTGTAIVTPEDESTLSYQDVLEHATELAGQLRSLGVTKGDHVALVMPNGPELVLGLLAIAWLGAAAAPLNPAYTRDEFRFYLTDLRPKLVLMPRAVNKAAGQAIAREAPIGNVQLQDRRLVLEVDGRAVSGVGSFEDPTPDDVALLLHTSGTTSRPKMVPLRHRNLMAAARAIARHYELAPTDVSFCAMPLFHVHGLVASTLSALLAGGQVVIPRRLSATRFWKALGQHGVTWFSCAPTIHRMLLEHAASEMTSHLSLRFVRSCSSALSAELMKQVESVVGVPMLEAYGMTEASHQLASNPLPPGRRLAGSVGVPTGTEIRVRSGGEFLDGEQPGELVVRGPSVMEGYANNAVANASAFSDGWFRTGDWGTIDSAGYVQVQGRIKDLIIRGGENISPAEIDSVLGRHPAVLEAVSFGVPDRKYGEIVAAAVVLRQKVDSLELISFCREHLAAFKVPQTIHVMEQLPKTATGKLQRSRIAALFRGEHAH